MNEYLSDKPLQKIDFEIKKLSRGDSQSNTINFFINGFLTEHDNETNWQNAFFDHDENYLVKWESGNLQQLGIAITAILSKIILRQSFKGIFGAVALPLIGMDLINNPWRQTVKKTGKVATLLYSHLCTLPPNKNINIYGHSLGTSIIWHLLKLLETDSQLNLNNIIFMGGATSSSINDWKSATENIQGSIYNFYSKNDSILKYLYPIVEIGKHPIGRRKIKSNSDKIINIDVSNCVDGHNDYKNHLSAILKYLSYSGSSYK